MVMKKFVAIKGVDEGTWARFKAEAARRRMHACQYFKQLVDSSITFKPNFDEIMATAGSLSDKDAEEIRKVGREIRKNFKMREWKW